MGLSVFPAPVSGPTLAEITTAITTNAAPASVTNSSIATQVANNAPSAQAWTLVSSATVNYSASQVTFSGLSGYRSYRLVVPRIDTSPSASWIMRINGDSSSIYDYWYPAPGLAASSNAFIGGASSGTSFMGIFEIYNANLAGAKPIKIDGVVISTNSFGIGSGMYRGTSTVNSITFGTNNGTMGNGNTIYLYGAN